MNFFLGLIVVLLCRLKWGLPKEGSQLCDVEDKPADKKGPKRLRQQPFETIVTILSQPPENKSRDIQRRY